MATALPCPEPCFAAVSTDSRHVSPGQLFFALRGPQHDGHDFVNQAFVAGAAAAVVERMPPAAPPGRLLVVSDSLRALGDLAAWTRRQYPLRVVAITGSNGKTTTKELVAAVCETAAGGAGAVLKTEGNLNNLIGLPLTLLRLRGSETVAVLELGMNQPGEIARLTEIATPTCALITNIGPVHLEGVGGTIAGVAAAKGELFAGLAPDAIMVVNRDDEHVRRLAVPFPNRKVTYGVDGDLRAHHVRDVGTDGVAFTLALGNREAEVRLRLMGAHNVQNALAAAAVGHALGIDLDVIAAGLARAEGVGMRLQVIRLPNGVTILNDAYNANPSSVEAALQAIRHLPGRPVVVVGEMRELGDETRRAHRQVGERAGALGVWQLIAVGDCAADVVAGARSAGMPADRVHRCPTHAAAAAVVRAHWRKGDNVLVKGSRGARMEEVVRLLQAARDEP
ncbi:UDP-N-acetylmuramoyl-tripeptide--D-alanyl-D-alanine ligase [Candidatus Binatia bacterium]|nr:UDP-N-acetylmuramoyl-tripeptide--D-alanyl-D-alanine ligase [Candidatus Binatia bacterium]